VDTYGSPEPIEAGWEPDRTEDSSYLKADLLAGNG